MELVFRKAEQNELSAALCDRNNLASARVIQNNGGVLENEVYSEAFSEIIQRYWIAI